jgi:molybdopterin molybdotransferase
MTEPSRNTTDDVRMRGFARRHTVEAAIALLDPHLRPLAAELLPLQDAAGRVLADEIVSAVDVPGFDRATMDGYAVVADSTEGATAYNPLPLRVIGDAFPGRPFQGSVGAGEAVRIMTGAPLPAGSNAVLPAEWIGESADLKGPPYERDLHVNALAAVSPGKHVGVQGEDVVSGTTVLHQGRRLRPQDLGLLSSIGIGQVRVVRRPRVRLIVTGNEILPAGSSPHGHCIADANGPMLKALAERDGATVIFPSLVPDDRQAILQALHDDADVILVSGGSSVGAEDIAPDLLREHGELMVHGVAMRPSSPTGFGRLEHRLVFLLPGNPVSCLCGYDFFAGRAIRALGALPREWPYPATDMMLARKISSPIGRLDYVRVKIVDGRAEPLATGSASVLSSTTRADGFVIVPADSEGFPSGADVRVWLYA